MREYIKPPSKEDYAKIANEFEEKWNLPNCIGAVDGKHITMRCPRNIGSTYFNNKKQFSVNLFAVCDPHYCFSIVEVGYAEIISDASDIFTPFQKQGHSQKVMKLAITFSWEMVKPLPRGPNLSCHSVKLFYVFRMNY
jgi:DDE superfamily endonuclease